jgi:hypothetical protein
MKLLRITALSLICLPVFAQSREGVHVSAKLTSKRYCSVIDNERIAILRARFNVRLSNTGQLALEWGVPFYPEVLLIARSPDDLRQKRYEFELHGPDFVPSSAPARPDVSKRKTIRPGETADFESMEANIPIARNKKTRQNQALAAGKHYLQLEMEIPTENASALVRAKSQPIAITVPEHLQLNHCD